MIQYVVSLGPFSLCTWKKSILCCCCMECSTKVMIVAISCQFFYILTDFLFMCINGWKNYIEIFDFSYEFVCFFLLFYSFLLQISWSSLTGYIKFFHCFVLWMHWRFAIFGWKTFFIKSLLWNIICLILNAHLAFYLTSVSMLYNAFVILSLYNFNLMVVSLYLKHLSCTVDPWTT